MLDDKAVSRAQYKTKSIPWLASVKLRLEADCTMWISTTTSPSCTPWSFRDFLSSRSGVPLKFKVISFAGKPDSISQNALKFSNSRSSDTCKTKISSLRVVTVTFMVNLISTNTNRTVGRYVVETGL